MQNPFINPAIKYVSCPNVFIGHPYQSKPGFPLTQCGNDEMISKLEELYHVVLSGKIKKHGMHSPRQALFDAPAIQNNASVSVGLAIHELQRQRSSLNTSS